MAPGRAVSLAGAALLLAALPAWPQAIGFLAFSEGKVSLVRGTTAYTAADGIRLYEGDILRTEAKSQAHIQLQDGTLLDLGPETRALVPRASAPRGAHGESEIAMLSGWAKLGLKKAASSKPYRIVTPLGQLKAEDATVVVHAARGVVEAFVESGSIAFSPEKGKGPSSAPRTVRSGEFLVFKGTQPPAVAPRPPSDFIKGMPPQFRDPLPLLPDKLKERGIQPRALREVAYEDVEDWLKSSLPVRPGLVKRFQGRARDPEFRGALVRNLQNHWEWDRILFPEKYEAREKEEAEGGKRKE